jgi:hypothetical protein
VPADKPKLEIIVNDDRSFRERKPYRLLIGTPFLFDQAPKESGKWWTVTITRAPYLLSPVTFHYTSVADAQALIGNIRSKLALLPDVA